MNRPPISSPRPATLLVESLEQRIAPAGLLNEAKFTSVVVGGSILLDASGGANDFQGLTTGAGGASGSYLLYVNAGKALVFTTDLNGNGRLDPGEITGISASVDSQGRPLDLTLFSDVHGDIVTNLIAGHGVNSLTDSDNNPNNGRDGQILNDIGISKITLRTLTAADIDPTIPGNTVPNRLALTSFSIYGNIVTGGDFGNASSGLLIDKSGESALIQKFNGTTGTQLYTGSVPSVGGIYTGTAANNLSFHFEQNAPFNPPGTSTILGNNVEGRIVPFQVPVNEHGGDISHISAASPTTAFSVGVLASGSGGFNARGGDISDVTYNGVQGSYAIIAGDGGQGATGGTGGSVLRFSDLNSITGEVLIHTGAGGVGLLGAGGVGGVATFATTKVAAQVSVFLGNGGQGFTQGGDGSGLPDARFTAPEGTVPTGSNFVGTWHNIGDIGNATPVANTGTNAAPNYTYSPDAIDWDGDGHGDGVYTGLNPDQVVVVFGDGAGGFDSGKTVILHTPGVTNPTVTVGDFNGDGRPDIAVASGNANNFGGVFIYLNQIKHPGDALPNPRNTTDFTFNPNGDHPFSEALQTAVPSLADAPYRLFQGPGAIAALAAGDFNGDGLTDLAYVQQATAIDPPLNPIKTVIGVLFGDPVSNPTTGLTVNDPVTGHPLGTGYFYANSATAPAAQTLQVSVLKGDPSVGSVLHATSLAAGNVPFGSTNGIPSAPEVFFYGRGGGTSDSDDSADNPGGRAIVPLGVGINPATHKPTLAGLLLTSPDGKPYGLGQVDTNRTLSGSSRQVTLENVVLQDFTLQDLDSNGQVDIIALSKTPTTFLVTFQQDPTKPGTFVVGSNNPNADQVNPGSINYKDNNGIFIGTTPVLPPENDIASVDADGDGHYNQFAILAQVAASAVRQYTLAPTTGAGSASSIFYSGGTPKLLAPVLTSGTTGGADITVLGGFDPIYATVPTAAAPFPSTDYGVISQNTSNYKNAYLYYYSAAGTSVPTYLTSNGFFLFSGDGGSSTTGPGGKGGKLGNTLSADTNGDALGSVSFVFPAYAAYLGEVVLTGGTGGSGFAGGGIGGEIAGVSVRYATGAGTLTSDVAIFGGAGGSGISGDGGNGGGVSQFSLLAGTGTVIVAGNGGAGLHGGNGGSILGNQAGFFDISNGSTSLFTGNGGQGALGGGQGGSINNIDTVFLPAIGGAGGLLDYETGNGGTAAGGGGGAGGNITNSSPDVNTNNLGGSLTLLTGKGGNGLTGGQGGNITTFVNQPTDSIAVATALSVITGNGGIGVAGVGGSGGNITGFNSNATGLTNLPGGALTGLARVIAGDGGLSIGSTGGVGGAITNVTVQATSTPVIVAAGAGGSGLTAGGAGGSVTSSIINSAARFNGKVLIVAGAGGDTRAALPSDVLINGDSDTTDLAHQILAFGGVSGLGGNGGNIEDVRQPVSTQTAVDLIAGNGGSTLNYGNALSATTNVGMGGSIERVILAGTLGSISRDTSLGAATNPPIKSYTAPDPVTGLTTTSVTAIVDYIASGGAFVLDDLAGNVGAVAGVAGQVKSVNGVPQPARDGVNGSVVTLTASSIMSIVAGSVDSVAPVQLLSGVTVTNRDGVLGADKSQNPPYGPNGILDYLQPILDSTGHIIGYNKVQNLEAGYKLIDGALFAITIVQPVEAPFITGPRVF